MVWGDAIDSQVTGRSGDLGGWWDLSSLLERVGQSQLACEQGWGLCRSQQVTGACGDLGTALESLGSFWCSRVVALIPRFSPCARLLLVWDSKRNISSVWQTQLALPHQSARKKKPDGFIRDCNISIQRSSLKC